MATISVTFYKDINFQSGSFRTPNPPAANTVNGPRNSGWAIQYGYWLDGETEPRTGVLRHDVQGSYAPILIDPPLMEKLDSLGRDTPLIAWDAEVTVPDEWRDVYIVIAGRIFFPYPEMSNQSFKAICGGPSTTKYICSSSDVVTAYPDFYSGIASPIPYYPDSQMSTVTSPPYIPYYGARSLYRDYIVGHPEGLGLDDRPLDVAFARAFPQTTSDSGAPYSQMLIQNYSQHEQAVSLAVEMDYGNGESETKAHSTTVPAGQIYQTSGYTPNGFSAQSGITHGVIMPNLLYYGGNAEFGFDPIYTTIPELGGTTLLELYNGPANSWIDQLNPYNPTLLSCITHAFRHQYTTENNAKARWRLKDERGLWSRWISAQNTPPLAAFTVDGEWNPAYILGEGDNQEIAPRWLVGETIHLDATKAFDVDGTIVNYHWAVSEYDAALINQEVTQQFDSNEPLLTYTLRNPRELSQLYVSLTVTDNEGLTGSLGVGLILTSAGVCLFGSFVDKAGVLYTAVADGQNVQVARFKTGSGSREPLALIEGAKNPAYDFDTARGTHLLSYESRSDGTHQLLTSRDCGRTFQ